MDSRLTLVDEDDGEVQAQIARDQATKQKESDQRTESMLQSYVDEEKQPEVDALNKKATDTIAENQNADIVPVKDGYNYAKALEQGYLPKPDAHGNTRMPVENFTEGRYIYGGYDAATGKKVVDNSVDVKRREEELEEAGLDWVWDDTWKAAGMVNDWSKEEAKKWALEIATGKISDEHLQSVQAIGGDILKGIGNDFIQWYQQTDQQLNDSIGFDLPDMEKYSRDEDMSLAETLTSEVGRWTVEFFAARGMLAKTKMSSMNKTIAADGAVMFFQDPHQGNIVDMLRQFGVMTDKKYDNLSALMAVEEGEITRARLNAMFTDAGPFAVVGRSIEAYRSIKNIRDYLRELKKWMNAQGNNPKALENAVDLQKTGVYTGNQPVAPSPEAGPVPEGVTKRIEDTNKSVRQMAEYYRRNRVSKQDFIDDMDGNGIPDKELAEAWGATEASSVSAATKLKQDAEKAAVRQAKTRAAVQNDINKGKAEAINISLSAATDKIPGIKRLHEQAKAGDESAAIAIREIANTSLSHLLEGVPSVKITREANTGLYDGVTEPSLGMKIDFEEEDADAVMAGLAKFAQNFDQEQVHVRQGSSSDINILKKYEDGSYDSPGYVFELNEPLSEAQVRDIIEQSGLNGLSYSDNKLTAYYVGDIDNGQELKQFQEAIEKAHTLAGQRVRSFEQAASRFWNYGKDGIPYERLDGKIRPQGNKQGNRAAKVIASRIAGKAVPGTNQAPKITPEQAALQTDIAIAYERMPDNDLKNPEVKAGYEALGRHLITQWEALPVKVSTYNNYKAGYKDSGAMRHDVLTNNHLRILKTDSKSFGPEGEDFTGHPLLEPAIGLDGQQITSLNGKPLLLNDVFRAVHDYYGHAMTPNTFGPLGEEAAWRNHMEMVDDPGARRALTTETRGQNSWVNFRPDLDKSIPVIDRPYARQKVAFLPEKYSQVPGAGGPPQKNPVDFGDFDKWLEKYNSLSPQKRGWLSRNEKKKTEFGIKEINSAFKEAQKEASDPVAEGGLGLKKKNTAIDRADAQGFDTEMVWLHGSTYPDIQGFTGGNTQNKQGYMGGFNYFTSSPKDSNANYAKVGVDLDSRISDLAYRIAENVMEERAVSEDVANRYASMVARKQLVGDSEGVNYPVYLKMERPINIAEDGDVLEWDEPEVSFYDEAKSEMDKADYTDEDGTFREDGYENELHELAIEKQFGYDYTGQLAVIQDELRMLGYKYDFDGNAAFNEVMYDHEMQPGESISAHDLVESLKIKLVNVVDPETGGQISGHIIAEALFESGYDGITMDASSTFGPKSPSRSPMGGGQMEMDYETTHVIQRDPENVRSIHAPFNPSKSKDSDLLSSIEGDTSFA